MVKGGDAFIEVHGDADPNRVQREIAEGFDRGAEQAEAELKETGKEIGDLLATSAGKEIEKQGPELAKSVERGINRRKIKAKVDVDIDQDNNFAERLVGNISGDIEKAFTKASGPGGPFKRIGSALADAVGAGFNISGRSPLIAVLVPLIGAIIGLVVAALQAANALIAVIATVPALIAAIGLQVGALAFAFHGLGTAVQGAFAAQNAQELDAALKPLTQSAANFVRELFITKSLFTDIAKLAQEAFFKNLSPQFGSGVIATLQKALGPEFLRGIPAVADALGRLFRDIGLFFASPTFVEFVRTVIPSTIGFLERFGPNFIHFLEGLTRFSIGILPFLETLGNMLGGTLFQLGDFLRRVTESGDLERWLDSMTQTLTLVLELFGGAIEFVSVFLSQLDAAGGQEVIQSLIDAFEDLAFLLSTPIGKQALEGLVDLAKISILVVTGVIEALFLLLAIGETVGEALHAFFIFVGEGILKAWEAIKRFFGNLLNGFRDNRDQLIRTVKELPGQALAALGNVGERLYQAGRNLIQGFINGMVSMGNPIANAARSLINKVTAFLPGSPAEEGPLSGQGYSMLRGQRMMEDFAKGIRMEIPEIRSASSEATSNIVFGRDAIRVTFEGALPTQQQAEQTGAAVGAGINGRLAARNTRLAVRTL